PPPPPPPVMAVPPPPFVPPPKIAVPPPPKPPIRRVTHAPPKTPPAPQQMTAEAPPVPVNVPSVPDTAAGSVPLNNVQPVYPPEMEEDNIEGRVTLVCDVETTGMTSNCTVRSVTGGQAFAASALDYVHRARYHPALRNGAPVKELHKVYVIRFRLDN
ncbi:MAG: energy transducer TonB, partial [Acetobacter papayae]|uniref:energy transducer TonB n=1 Tax=Acetobacter papayae TaxID=1076592 RepID=UPI0039E8880E